MRLWNIPSIIGFALIASELLMLAIHSEWPVRFGSFVGSIRLFGGDVDIR
jgi:hypothetical protein